MLKSSFKIALLAGVAAIALTAPDFADAKDKKEKSNHSFSGAAQVTYSIDRNAGVGSSPTKGIRGAREDDDEDEEDEEDEEDPFAEDDFDSDILDDLDLDDEDALDDIEDAEEDFPDDDGADAADGADGGDADAADAGGDAADAAADAGDAGGDAQALVQARAIPRKTAPNGKADSRIGFRANFGHKYKIAGDKDWKSAINFNSADQAQLDKNDTYTFALATGPVWYFSDKKWSISPQISYARVVKDSEFTLFTVAASLGAQYKFNKQWAVSGKYIRDSRNLEKVGVPNSDGNTFKVGVKYVPTKRDAFALDLGVRFDDTKPNTRDKATYDAKVGYKRDFANDYYAAADYTYKYGENDLADPRLFFVEESFQHVFQLAVGKTFANKTSLELQYETRSRDSTFDNKDGSNDRVVIAGGWKF